MIERLIDILKERPYTLEELSKIFQKDKKVILKYIEEIEKIAKRKGFKLKIQKAYCRKCGFVFKDYDPSKCPKCGSEWIEKAKFYIIK